MVADAANLAQQKRQTEQYQEHGWHFLTGTTLLAFGRGTTFGGGHS